jgi:hypothetical protein
MSRWKKVTFADWRPGFVYRSPHDSGHRWAVLRDTGDRLEGYCPGSKSAGPHTWDKDPLCDTEFYERAIMPHERTRGIQLLLAQAAGVKPYD